MLAPFVILAAWAFLGADSDYTLNIETILASSCHDGTQCDKTVPDINFTAIEHGLNVTLMVVWFNPSNIFQLYSYIKSAGKHQVSLFLIDEHLTRLSTLPPSTPDCPYVVLPETFWLYEEEPEPEPEDECCEGFLTLEEFEQEPPEIDVNKCFGWLDPAEGLIAVIRHLKWRKAFVIYDAMNEQQMTNVISNIDSCQFVISLIESTDSSTHSENTTSWSNLKDSGKNHQNVAELEIRRLVRSIHDSTSADDSIQIVVLCSLINIKRIMSVANTFDLERNRSSALNFRSRWLIALPTDRTVDDELTNFLEDMTYLDNVVVVDSRYTQHKQDQMNISQKLEELAREFMLRIADVKNKSCVLELTNEMMQVLQSDNVRCTDTQVNALYFGGLKGRYLNTVAMVNNARDVLLRGADAVFPNTLFALNNRTLKISTVQWDPFVTITEKGYDGLCMDMLKQMQVVLNFTAEIVEPPDEDWGRPMKNDSKSFTGLVGQLQRQEVDMVVAPLTMEVERARAMDFAFPFFTDYTTVVFKRQDPAGSKWLTLIRPFKWQVHLTIWISLFSVAIMITILERQNPYYEARSEKSAFYNVIDSIWYMYGSLLTQGGEDLPTSTTGLTLVSFWLMFSVIVASTYSGNLIAFLTVNLDPLPFDSLQGMGSQHKYKFGTVGDSSYEWIYGFQSQEQLLKISTNPIRQDIWEQIKRFNKSDPSVLSSNVNIHKAKVSKGGYAYIGDRSLIDTWTSDPELRTIKENFFPVQYAVGLVKNSPYRIQVSKAMIYMNDRGLFQTWSSRRWPKPDIGQGNLFTAASAISLQEVQSAFYMLAVGIVLSLLILGAEKMATYYTSRCGKRRYSFQSSLSDNKAELTLNDSVENRHHSYELSDRFSYIPETTATDNVLAADAEQTMGKDVFAIEKPIQGCHANDANALNQFVDFSCADSWDSGFDDQQQRRNPYVFKDKVPFYLSRISLPKFLVRSRSTSL
ncbi:hypothetical protein BsWGS_10536 [Bradybaena similaris]